MNPTTPFLRVLLLCLLLCVGDAFAAKRLGGGQSIGRQRDTTTFQRAPSATPAPPVANPQSPALQPALPASVSQPARPPFAQPAPQRSWLGPLAGFAGGALLGGLLFGHGGSGVSDGAGLGLFGWLLLLGAGVWLARRFLRGAALPQPMLRTEPAGWMPAPPPQANPVPPLAAAAPDGAALRLPPGFDLPAFLRESRLAFVRLQAANDRADIADLREFTTPQMFAELALQIQERRGATQQVEVVALDAQLLDLTVEQEEAIASVQFHGTAREDQGPAEAFTEVWHVRKKLADPRSSWLLAGIQQTP